MHWREFLASPQERGLQSVQMITKVCVTPWTLGGLARDSLSEDPITGHWYLLFMRHRNRLKILVWDRNGYWLLRKRLERGVFDRLEGDFVPLRNPNGYLALDSR
ncbi:MAG: IS66 family insertion sequence element accessory protein TnpB [Planctomycetes bacterium]|nr:IS66 family insertion sequence element accessory protein TnpB [Planctomycetota bacterium]